MKYKGFVIKPSYFCGSDFTITKLNTVRNRKPTTKDIEYYEVFDPNENMDRWVFGDSIKDCKEQIDSFLKKANMKSNLPSEWAKLDS